MMEWTHPHLHDEIEEFSRTAEDLGIPEESLISAYTMAEIRGLGDDVWSKLENSDSYGVKSEEDARVLAETYSRDIDSIFEAIEKDSQLPAPIVLLRSNHPPYLIAGNTRLMAARAKKINPDVLFLEMESRAASLLMIAHKIACKF